MMNDELLRYFDKEMSEEERLSFESRLETDEALRDELKYLRAAHLMADSFIELETKETIQKIKAPELQSEKPGSFFFKATLIIGLALALLLTVKLFNKDGDAKSYENIEQLYAAQYTEPIWPLVRGEQDEISQAISLYLSGDIETALSALNNLNSPEAEYWSVEIWVHAKNFKAALEILERLKIEDSRKERINLLMSICQQAIQLE
jgi:hypothetical protein